VDAALDTAVVGLQAVQASLTSLLTAVQSGTQQVLLVAPAADAGAALAAAVGGDASSLTALVGWEARLSVQEVLADAVSAQRQLLSQLQDTSASTAARVTRVTW
jgi:phage baseplate assembly protein W